MQELSEKSKGIAIGVVLVVTLIWIFQYPSIGQSPYFHLFADDRTLLGVPNFWNVASNIIFLFVGVHGLLKLPKIEESLKISWLVFFLGIFLTGLGSSHYHLKPSNASLVFDRLPMTMGFMGLVNLLIAERVSKRMGSLLLYPMLALGMFSVFYWIYTEKLGAGDLRLYLWVQFGGLALAFSMIVIYTSRLLDNKLLLIGFGCYAIAKVFEAFDVQIFILFRQQMSGHTLKHFAAAAGAYALLKSYPEDTN